mgnify:CR=1 FL=1
MHPPVGIDLGTSTSIISYFTDGNPKPIPDPATKSPIIPSVVGLSMSGKETLVGQYALDQSRPGQLLMETKRGTGRGERYRLGDRQLSAEEVATLILAHLKRNAEAHLGEKIRDVVISVPANYEDVRRRAVMESARMAGLNVVRLINEPTAAAMAYGIQALNAEELLLVYDFGGGTLDVTILEMIQGVLDVRTSHGVAELGGKDLDACIMQWAEAEFVRRHPGAKIGLASERRLKAQAEPAKKALSTYDSASIIVENYATQDGELLDLDLRLSRSGFEEMIRPLVARSVEAVDEALSKAAVSPEQLTKVLLVGGTTWIPAVRNAVLTHLAKPAVSGCDPDLAVSMGACISAALAAGEVDSKSSLVVQDVCTYGLGTLNIQNVGGIWALAYDELMPPNTPIPYSVRRDHYSLQRLDQDQMEVDLVQDLRGDAVWPDDTTPTGCSGSLTGIPPSETDTPHDVSLEFHYDANGIVHLRAWLPDLDNMELHLTHDASGAGSRDIIPEDEGMDALWEHTPLGGKYAVWIRRAEAAIAESPPNVSTIQAATVELKTKISMGAEAEAQRACDHLIDLLTEA